MIYKNQNIQYLQNVDEEKNVAQVQMFGAIGADFDGNRFAMDLMAVAGMGFDEVNININSVGGSIVEGFSILSAMNTIRMNGGRVATSGMGVMDSMAGIVLAFGDRGRRTATSFSSGVIHEPLVQDEKGNQTPIDQLPEGELRKELEFMRDALITSLTGSTGMTRAQLRKVMQEGTRRDARELKDLGMIDRIVEVTNQVDVKNLSRVEAMAACSKVVISPVNVKSKSKTMSLVNQKLGLNAEASEAAQASAVDNIINRAEKAEADAAKVGDLQTQIDTLKNEKKALEDKLAEGQTEAIGAFVDAQIEAGKFDKEKREALVAQAEKDFPGFKVFCESLNGQFVDVTKNLGGNGGNDGDAGKGSDDKMLVNAQKFHQHDCNGTLDKFKNEVGEKKFSAIEEYLGENFDSVLDSLEKKD